MLRTPYPHQFEALEWAKYRSAVAFYHEMRLGKCLTSIRWALSQPVHRHSPKLVIAPLSTLPGWQEELTAEGQQSELLQGSSDQRLSQCFRARAEGRWCLMNWEGLLSCPDIACMLWSVGLFDESDRIKNPQAKTTKSVLRMQVQYRCLLSGLPSPLSRLDLFTQMQFLEGGTWMLCRNFWEWRDRYFEPVGYSWVAKPGTVKAIQEAMTDYAHCRTRKQVGLDNTSVKKVLYVDLPPKVRKAYDKAEKEFVLGDKQTKWKLVTRLWTRRLCSGCLPSSLQDLTHDAKYKELGRLLDGSLKGQQVVVWAFFRREVLAARAWFEKRGESVRCITGDTPVQQRKEYCRLFQTGKVRYLVLQVQTGKYGLNLSNASTAVYLSLSDSLSDLRQSRDRIVHMSKVGKGPNLFVYLLVRDSVEQDQYEVLQERGVEARDVLEQSYTRMLARLKGK